MNAFEAAGDPLVGPRVAQERVPDFPLSWEDVRQMPVPNTEDQGRKCSKQEWRCIIAVHAPQSHADGKDARARLEWPRNRNAV